MRLNTSPRAGQRGFTLVELVMVIVIMGVIGGTVAVFMKSPIDAYFDSARRAGLTDVADTTVRRIERDIRKALPNSVRSAGNQCVEFIPTKIGARYRAGLDGSGGGDVLDFGLLDTSFNMFGRNTNPPAQQQIVAGDWVAVYNLGISGADAYAADNTSAVTAASAESGSPAESVIAINAKQFALGSPSNRFHVIPQGEQVVRFVCVDANGINAQGHGNGTLYRQVLALPLAASASCPTSVVGAARLANRVSACNFSYSGTDLQRNALLSLRLQLTDSSETVSLQQEVHVSNTP